MQKRFLSLIILLCLMSVLLRAQDLPVQPKPARVTFTGYLEGVTAYHGPDLGDWFQRNPAARLVLQLNRITDSQTIFVGTWSGVGRYFNNETDFNAGLLRNLGKFKLGGEAAYYAVLGGDIYRVAGVVVLPSIDIKGRQFNITGQYIHFGKVSRTSPYGGEVVKLITNYTKVMGDGASSPWAVNHQFQLSWDDNPFFLGKMGTRDWTGTMFYTLSVGRKLTDTVRFDIMGSLSTPYMWAGNTKRGFRHSAGLRFTWDIPITK